MAGSYAEAPGYHAEEFTASGGACVHAGSRRFEVEAMGCSGSRGLRRASCSSIAAGRSTAVAAGVCSQWKERQGAVVRCSKHAGAVGTSGKYRKEGQNGENQSQ